MNQEEHILVIFNLLVILTIMLRSNLCDYADGFILVNGTITITGAGDDAAKQLDEIKV